jgi:uncharacterized Zn-finger protein
MYQHQGEMPFKCPYQDCNFETAYCGNLKLHKLTHEGEKRYKCKFPGCKYATAYQQHFARHTLTHTGEKPFACDYPNCGYRGARSDYLKLHKKNKHPLKTLITCQWCPFETRSLENLAAHQIIHTEDDDFFMSDNDDDEIAVQQLLELQYKNFE